MCVCHQPLYGANAPLILKLSVVRVLFYLLITQNRSNTRNCTSTKDQMGPHVLVLALLLSNVLLVMSGGKNCTDHSGRRQNPSSKRSQQVRKKGEIGFFTIISSGEQAAAKKH
jgi:hypothetical protein